MLGLTRCSFTLRTEMLTHTHLSKSRKDTKSGKTAYKLQQTPTDVGQPIHWFYFLYSFIGTCVYHQQIIQLCFLFQAIFIANYILGAVIHAGNGNITEEFYLPHPKVYGSREVTPELNLGGIDYLFIILRLLQKHQRHLTIPVNLSVRQLQVNACRSAMSQQHQLGQLPATDGDGYPSLFPLHPRAIHTTHVTAAAFEFWSPQT